ncbi:hypothetical protein CHISP_2618 [Chitinispirillum alkaliphilum]|nr:hypothetical protein CHISP_2618 [Chitinispirillum alkaliphilum]
MKKNEKTSEKGLSFTVIAMVGLVCAVLFSVTLFAINHLYHNFSPSLRSSQRLFERGRYEDALSNIEKIPLDNRSNAELYILRAKILLSMLHDELKEEQWGSYGQDPQNWIPSPLAADAQQSLILALEEQPHNRDALFLLGNLYKRQGRFEKALRKLRYVSELYPEDIEVLLSLAVLFSETDQFTRSEDILRKAWGIDTSNPDVAKNLAFLYRYHLFEPESSMVWFNRYLNLNPVGDLDVNLARKELIDLMDRYPEFVLPDSLLWREKGKRFTSRH